MAFGIVDSGGVVFHTTKGCYTGRGLIALIAEASKVYRVAEFDKLFNQICSINPLIGKYLVDADVKKWALGFL